MCRDGLATAHGVCLLSTKLRLGAHAERLAQTGNHNRVFGDGEVVPRDERKGSSAVGRFPGGPSRAHHEDAAKRIPAAFQPGPVPVDTNFRATSTSARGLQSSRPAPDSPTESPQGA